MNLKSLEYFIRVVDLNSFSKAAEESFISQSAISQQIKSMEEELGFSLMIRNKRSFTLTEAGKYLYLEGKNIIQNVKDVTVHAQYISKNPSQELRIGHVANYGYHELKKALMLFSEKYPEIKVYIKDGPHETVSVNNINDVTDIMIGDQRKTFSPLLQNEYLGDLYYSIKVSDANNLSYKNSISIDELKGYSCIVIASREEMAKEVEFMKTTLEFDGEFLCASTLTEAYLMVAANLGFLPVATKQTEKSDDGSITTLPLWKDGSIFKTKLYGFYKKSFDDTIYTQLLDVVKSVLN